MSEQDKSTAAQPEKKQQDAQPDPKDKKPEDKNEITVGDAMKPQPAKKEETEKPETVGLDKFLEVKSQVKEQAKVIKELQKKIEEGATTSELVDDLDALAEEYELDKKFVAKLAKAIENRAKKGVETIVQESKKKDEEASEKGRIEEIFDKNFNKAIKDMPEFADVADRDDLFALSLLPKNANKTFKQLIEDTYGKGLGGKRTIESTKPHGGKEPEGIDYDRVQKDPKYFDEIMANPELKKKYNEGLVDRVGKYL